MQWSATTCERLSAIEIHMTLEQTEMDKAADDYKTASESRDESEKSLLDAVREARGQHPDGDWPEDVTSRIAGFSKDFDQRTRIAKEQEARKKRHQKEYERAKGMIPIVIREAREGDSLYEQGKDATPDAWRLVMIGDIADEKTAGALSGKGVMTLGQLIEKGDDGTLMQLVEGKELSAAYVSAAVRALTAYVEAREINLEDESAAAITSVGRAADDKTRELQQAAEAEAAAKPEEPEAGAPADPAPITTPDAPAESEGAKLAHPFEDDGDGACKVCGHGKDWNLHGQHEQENGGS